ncbi:unnamed protein product [Caenorhabditis angaria]|uniref:Uncharacterized protein n=1 Tax=Caenorhabditis angaria TaxID=860376 RepID=A0A9P1IL18_9PELO|nr:unnamed protein product [Caenorhabditis angaria]
MGFLQSIEWKKRIKMRVYIRAVIGLIGVLHIGMGIWVAIQADAESVAVSPIEAALMKLGEKGYTDHNSQAKAAFMPFIVGIFCLIFAVTQFYVMFYVLFILVLLESIFFVWSLVSVVAINNHQKAHYDLINYTAKAMLKKAKEEAEKKKSGGSSSFLDGIRQKVINLANKVGLGDLVEKAIDFVGNFNIAGFSTQEKISDGTEPYRP